MESCLETAIIFGGVFGDIIRTEITHFTFKQCIMLRFLKILLANWPEAVFQFCELHFFPCIWCLASVKGGPW